MKQTRLLLPFVHSIDTQALEVAIRFAHSHDALLVTLALIHIPIGRCSRGARLDFLQQAKDFSEAVYHKAAKYEVTVEQFEMSTHDVVGSISSFAHAKMCDGILLFTSGGKGLLLQTREIKALIEQKELSLYLIHIPRGTRLTRSIWQRLGLWWNRQQPVDVGTYSEEQLAWTHQSFHHNEVQ